MISDEMENKNKQSLHFTYGARDGGEWEGKTWPSELYLGVGGYCQVREAWVVEQMGWSTIKEGCHDLQGVRMPNNKSGAHWGSETQSVSHLVLVSLCSQSELFDMLNCISHSPP